MFDVNANVVCSHDLLCVPAPDGVVVGAGVQLGLEHHQAVDGSFVALERHL